MVKPGGSPGCWGIQYTEGEKDCMQCAYKASCSQQCLKNSMAAPMRQHLPMYQPPQPTGMVPMPQRPAYSPPAQPAPQIPQPPAFPTYSQPYPVPQYPVAPPPPQPPPMPVLYRPQPPAPQPQAPVVQYYQQYQPAMQAAGSIPDPYNPNPLVPMMRPGAPGPAYYFCQYPGETTATRLAKNMVLRAGEAIFGEGMSFLRHWTWPPRTY